MNYHYKTIDNVILYRNQLMFVVVEDEDNHLIKNTRFDIDAQRRASDQENLYSIDGQKYPRNVVYGAWDSALDEVVRLSNEEE